YISKVLDNIDNKTIPTLEEIIEPARLFPRQSTAELVDAMGFHTGLFESIGLGMFVIDRDAQIIRANDLGLAMINKPIQNILNSHVKTLLPESKKAELVSALKLVARDPIKKSVSFEVDTDDQRLRVIVSIHRVGQEAIGWIIATEDKRQWEEPV
ncbi:MAG TPA: PAS domain-containing protein, partial [Desulfatirhabdiaceae bacterium]|nr:PAS domain-containing protein [Desulfatirhabdiaceae bacterium]